MYNAQVCECKIFYYAKYISGLMLCEMCQAAILVQCKFLALPHVCYGNVLGPKCTMHKYMNVKPFSMEINQ